MLTEDGVGVLTQILTTPSDPLPPSSYLPIQSSLTPIPCLHSLHPATYPQLLPSFLLSPLLPGEFIRIQDNDLVILLKGTGKLLIHTATLTNTQEIQEEMTVMKTGHWIQIDNSQDKDVSITALESSLLCRLPCSSLFSLQDASSALYFQEKLLFLRSIPVFSSLSKSLLSKICAHLHLQHYHKNQVIYRENDSVREVYLVVAGEVLISKDIQLVLDDLEVMRYNSRSPVRKNQVKSPLKKSGKICIKQAKELFGDEDEAYRTATASCFSAKLTVYSISKAEFARKIGNLTSVGQLNRRKKMEKEWFGERLKSLYKAERGKLMPLIEKKESFVSSKDSHTPEIRAFRRNNESFAPKSAVNIVQRRSRSIFLTADTSVSVTPEPYFCESPPVREKDRRMSSLTPSKGTVNVQSSESHKEKDGATAGQASPSFPSRRLTPHYPSLLRRNSPFKSYLLAS